MAEDPAKVATQRRRKVELLVTQAEELEREMIALSEKGLDEKGVVLIESWQLHANNLRLRALCLHLGLQGSAAAIAPGGEDPAPAS